MGRGARRWGAHSTARYALAIQQILIGRRRAVTEARIHFWIGRSILMLKGRGNRRAFLTHGTENAAEQSGGGLTSNDWAAQYQFRER